MIETSAVSHTKVEKVIIQKLIYYATRAPSGHNTQPWLFDFTINEIIIRPDLTRVLPVVDSDNHALYISLGCAAENIVIAAKPFGFDSVLSIRKSRTEPDFISVVLTSKEDIRTDELFDFIDKRQATRNAYQDEQVPPDEIAALKESFDFKGIELSLYTTPDEITLLSPFIIDGSNSQFQNKEFVDELVSWIRFSKSEVEEKLDGIWHSSMGMPATGRLIGEIIMKNFITPQSEAKRWKKMIGRSAGFALFTVEKNSIANWVALGQSFQRFALTATKLGISHAHVNMPCEELEVRQQLITQLELGTRQPLLLIRFGYSEKMPYSLRREIQDVIIKSDP